MSADVVEALAILGGVAVGAVLVMIIAPGRRR